MAGSDSDEKLPSKCGVTVRRLVGGGVLLVDLTSKRFRRRLLSGCVPQFLDSEVNTGSSTHVRSAGPTQTVGPESLSTRYTSPCRQGGTGRIPRNARCNSSLTGRLPLRKLATEKFASPGSNPTIPTSGLANSSFR